MTEELDRSKQVGGVEPHTTSDPLVVLLYLLMRDYLTAGIFEKLVMEMGDPPMDLTNPFLAQYAENIALRLVTETDIVPDEPTREMSARVFRELTDEDVDAIVGGLEITRRHTSTHELYGGINTQETVKGLEKLLERFDKEVPL